jgi:hypothetical protein
MEHIAPEYLSRAEFWLLVTTLVYFLMNGAQIFETVVFVPRWTSSPPENFGMLIDGNGAGLKFFWIIFHSLHEITFILAIIFCWKIEPIRNWLLILFTAHFAVRCWTLSYFAPTIMEFQKIAENPSLAKDLVKKTSLWQSLNYVRVAIFIFISMALVPLCFKLFNLRN